MAILAEGVAVYLLVITLLAQSISPLMEWAYLARRGVGETLRLSAGWVRLGPGEGGEEWRYLIPPAGERGAPLAYITWANTHTPQDALFIEEDLAGEPNQLHLLERMRFADPEDVAQNPAGERDFTLAGGRSAAWASFGGAPGTLLERALASTYVTRYHPPLFYVSRSGEKGDLGSPVYRDDYVVIYSLDR
jgi:hypothetical protein